MVEAGTAPPEWTGGPKQPKDARVRRLVSLVAFASGIFLAAALLFYARDPLIGVVRLGFNLDQAAPASVGEPAVTHAFIAATLRGDGPAMRQQVAQSCLNDMDASLCFDSTADASWRSYVRTHQMRGVYIGREGAYVFYLIYTRNSKTNVEHDATVILHLSAQGRIDSERNPQF